MTVTAPFPSVAESELGALAERLCSVLGDGTQSSAIKILTALALSAVPNATGAGVTLLRTSDEPTTVAATSELVLEADALQHYLREGPCIDARQNATAVHATDLLRDGRWPAWAKSVRPLNIVSLMSVPLVTAGQVRGTLTVYCDMPGAFSARTRATFHQISETVAKLLGPAAPPST